MFERHLERNMCAAQLECGRRASRPCRDFDLPRLGWSGRGGDGTRVACFVGTCLDMAWSGRGGDGIRVVCFSGPAVLDEVHARVGHA